MAVPTELLSALRIEDNNVNNSRDSPLDQSLSMIQSLIDCDDLQNIVNLKIIDEMHDANTDLNKKMCQKVDSLIYELVQWTKRLPFHRELPVEVHTRLLNHKWPELVVLTSSAYQAMHSQHMKVTSSSNSIEGDEFTREVSNNMYTLHSCLTNIMGMPIRMEQLRRDVGILVDKMTYISLMFTKMQLRMEEYVCLKLIMLFSEGKNNTEETKTKQIQKRYISCLKNFIKHSAPQQPNRYHDLLLTLPDVRSAAALLLKSQMFYVPLILNSAVKNYTNI